MFHLSPVDSCADKASQLDLPISARILRMGFNISPTA